MLRQGVISPVTVPTEWCSGIVPVPKPNGRVRICVDLTPLNKAVQRETHPMGSVDESLAMLGESRIFTKLDANSGFWQIPLDDDSKLLIAFITPFGRLCFNRLPFGISSAPEIFQRTMSDILQDLDGVVCRMDDILIHGRNHVQHDARVRAVLLRLQRAGLTLNIQKCEFLQGRLKFLGHIVDAQGVHADPEKTRAIGHFPTPTTVTELQRFMGMVNQLGKFVPGLADINAPLRQLLRKDSACTGMKLSKEHSSKSKRSLHHLKSLHITTPTVKQSLPQMHHQQGWEQFFFKNKIMDSVVQSATSPDPLVRLKGTMQSSRRKRSPQPGHANGLKSTSLDSGLPWKQITSHFFHSSLQPTCPRCPLEYCGSAFE